MPKTDLGAELEQSGVIEQYRAVVSPAAVGLTFALVVLLLAGSVLLAMGDNIAAWVAGLG